MSSNTDKKKICLEISKNLYRQLNQEILDKYGQTFGHIGKSIEEGIELWLAKKNSEKKLVILNGK